MLKFLKYINVVGLVKTIIKYGEHVKLVADTASYWHTQAIARKLIKEDQQITE